MEYSNVSYIFGAVGILTGFASFICSLYQKFKRKKLQSFSRSQAWYLYKKATRLLATIRSADELYHKNEKSTLEPEIVKKLAKSEAFGIEILDETIRHIQLFDPNVKREEIKQLEDKNSSEENNPSNCYQSLPQTAF